MGEPHDIWMSVTDPRLLLGHDAIVGRYSARKLRLLALALAREAEHLVRGDDLRAGFAVAERVAGLPEDHEEEELVAGLIALRRSAGSESRPWELAERAFCEAIGPAYGAADDGHDYLDSQYCKPLPLRVALFAAQAVAAAAAGPAPRRVAPGDGWHAAYNTSYAAAFARLADLTRCVLGNPYRPAVFDPKWRTGTVIDLTMALERGREFAGLPVLADAVEEAGCDDAELLAHLRGSGPHALGCAAVDAILARG